MLWMLLSSSLSKLFAYIRYSNNLNCDRIHFLSAILFPCSIWLRRVRQAFGIHGIPIYHLVVKEKAKPAYPLALIINLIFIYNFILNLCQVDDVQQVISVCVQKLLETYNLCTTKGWLASFTTTSYLFNTVIFNMQKVACAVIILVVLALSTGMVSRWQYLTSKPLKGIQNGNKLQ